MFCLTAPITGCCLPCSSLSPAPLANAGVLRIHTNMETDMTYDTPERLDAGLNKLIATLERDKPDLVAETYTEAELARHCVHAVWEREPDEHGEHGLIEELKVREGRYLVDITELVKTGWFLPDSADDTHTVTRYDSTAAEYEIEVRCELAACWKDGERWLAMFDVSEVL